MLIASLLLIAAAAATSRAADISEVGGTRNNGYFALNKQIQFNCVYDNTAFIFVSFGHNSSGITSGGRYYIQDSHTHHSLVVSHTIPSDSGTWSCTLRSVMNQRTITRTTTVMYEESIVFTPAESSLVGAYGRPYTITCRGENIRTWEWILDDVLVANSSDGRLQVWSNGRIHFTSLQYDDAGVYYCRAANFYDSNKIATYTLTVNALPTVAVVKQPSSVIKANDSLNITCTASGVGLVSVTWSKESDGGQLTNGNDHSVTTNVVFQNDTSIVSVLRFTAVTGSQQDTYRCNATSTAGSSYELTEVSLSGLPGAPPPPSLSVIDINMVRVRWETPVDTGNLNISHFQINYGKVGERGDQSPLQLELPAHHMEYVFSLLLATRYYFSVAAMNEHGRGPFSEQNEITTNSTIADALMIMATDVTTNAVLLSWQPLTGNGTGGSPITGYVITYYNDSGSPVTKSIDISEASNDSYWLNGLEDNTQYYVMICAVNTNGCGKQSSSDFITPLSLPEPVSELSAVMVEDDKSITISWMTKDTNDQVYYLITVTGQDNVVSVYNFTTSMITINGTIHSVHVPELQTDKCYNYQIIVTAVNEKGKSTPVSTNITCSSDNEPLVTVEGEINVSSEDDQLSSSVIIAIAVAPVILLLLVIVVVVIFIIRCNKYRKHNIEMGTDYNGKKRDSESSTAPINYHRNDSIDTQDSFGSQLSTPHTIDSFMSENVLPFRMSTAGPLDPIRESPSIDEPSRFTSPEDGGVKWTVGPASATTVNSNVFEYEEESKSPMILDPGQPFIDATPVYVDNPAYYSVSREYDAKLPDNYSTVKIVPDKKNDGKEVVILPEKR